MSYAQEKYEQANDIIEPITGLRLASRDIDRILSIFATVSQVTTPNERVSIQKLAPLVCGGQRLCDAWDAIDRVLAERGPVIAVQTAHGMVSLEDVKQAVDAQYYLTFNSPEARVIFVKGVMSRLAKKKPEPTVTLLDPTGGQSMDVPASVVHEMEYPEVVMYTPIDFTETDECNICGACVADRSKHTAFHGRSAR
jgi:hypothetical protein